MKVKCKKDDLLFGFQIVQNISNARTTLPILGNVLLNAKGENITLTATDLELGMQVKIPSKIDQEGVTTLPSKKMFSLIRELVNPDLEIEVEGNHLTSIHSGTSFFKIVGASEADFPKLPSFERKKGFEINQKDLRDLIRKTSYAVSKDETRYVLTGILIQVESGKVSLIATDGRRLAIAQVKGSFGEETKEIVLPLKAVSEISKVLGDEGQVELIPFDNQIAFVLKNASASDQCVVISRLLEGNFPNYKQVIPEKVKERVVLDREEFLSAIRRVSVVTSEKSSLIKVIFSKNLLILSAQSTEVGEAKEEIHIAYEGPETPMAFNPNYLSDALRNMDEDEITFEFNDSTSAGVIRSGTSFLYVVMPMRIA